LAVVTTSTSVEEDASAPAMRGLIVLLAAIAAFGLYWGSSFILAERRATLNFGADAHLYLMIAKGEVLDRVLRFHPVTVGLAVAWMKVLSPLTAWLTPPHLLKSLFAVIGAGGVLAATSAFMRVVPRSYAILFGVIYAVSFGIWYFASIEESKIVTATLSALYIAIYLHLRENWTMAGAVALTAVLLIACLNEIVSGFLIVIPFADILLRRGWDWQAGRWLLPHALAGPLALAILEFGVNGRLTGPATDAEGGSHLSMLVYYILKSDHGVASFYGFLLNWLCFNIAAPTSTAPYLVTPPYGGYFEPALAGYFSSPVTACAALLLGAVILAVIWAKRPAPLPQGFSSLLLALTTYSVLRGAFFFIFNPSESLLFSPAVTLAHLLIIGVPFTLSAFPAKHALLIGTGAALFAANGAFILWQ
jgi:hypothetical protein